MKTAVLGLLVGGMALAAGTEQRGTAASVDGLQVNGAAVPAAGTKTWPVMAGDEIKSSAAPVVLMLKDGSKIVLGANSAAKFETTAGGQESLRLVNGTMNYQMSTEAKTQLVVNNQPLVVTPGATGMAGAGATETLPKLGAQTPKASADEDEDKPPKLSRR